MFNVEWVEVVGGRDHILTQNKMIYVPYFPAAFKLRRQKLQYLLTVSSYICKSYMRNVFH